MDENCIETAIQSYLNHCRFEKGLDSKTIKAYQIDLLQFSAFIQKEGNSYCKGNLQAYIACLHGHYKIKSVKRKIASLKAFFNVNVKATSENRLPAGSKRACRSVNPLHL